MICNVGGKERGISIYTYLFIYEIYVMVKREAEEKGWFVMGMVKKEGSAYVRIYSFMNYM